MRPETLCTWCEKPYPCCGSVESAHKENAALRLERDEAVNHLGQYGRDVVNVNAALRAQVEELKRERDRQRGAAEKHYALAEERLVLLDHAEERAERAEARRGERCRLGR